VRARWLYPAALILLLAPAGCGGVSVSGAEPVLGDNLTVYSSLPLHGPESAISTQIVNGERLALADAGGEVGHFRISLYSLDDSSPTSNGWAPGVTATNAKLAAQDNDAIAYVGDYDSPATAVSLPLTNGAGILQITPGSPYVGLTSSRDAGQDEPARFYPSGKITFGRLIPGDLVEAAADVALMRSMGIKRVYALSNEDPFDMPLAELVLGDAERAGIAVAGDDRVDVGPAAAAAEITSEAEKVSASGAQAVFFSGPAEAGTVKLFRALHAADPRLALIGSHQLAEEGFTSQLGAAAGATLLSTPWLAPRLYPRAAQLLLQRYRARFREAPLIPALSGYEAMSVTLNAIRRAGTRGNSRQAVIAAFFATKDRDSVLGRYSMQANGETTLSRYGIDRVVEGRPSFYRAFDVQP
jgi:branched-chain amino acid transport system substrate-binding protein